MEKGKIVVNGGQPQPFVGFHWHPNAHEIVTVESGRCRIVMVNKSLIGTENEIDDRVVGPGDTTVIQIGAFHYIESDTSENSLINISFSIDEEDGVEVVDGMGAIAALGQDSLNHVYNNQLSLLSADVLSR